MIFNPFQPKEVKMSNYHPEQIEQNKLQNTMEKTQMANGRVGEYQKGFEEKTYKDAVKMPKTYGQVLGHEKTYSEGVKMPKTYGEVMPKESSYSDAFKPMNRNMGMENMKRNTPNNFNGFKNN